MSNIMNNKTKALVQLVRDHALQNYNKDGWDFLVECWSDETIAEIIEDAKTPKVAISRAYEVVQLLDERRAGGGEY